MSHVFYFRCIAFFFASIFASHSYAECVSLNRRTDIYVVTNGSLGLTGEWQTSADMEMPIIPMTAAPMAGFFGAAIATGDMKTSAIGGVAGVALGTVLAFPIFQARAQEERAYKLEILLHANEPDYVYTEIFKNVTVPLFEKIRAHVGESAARLDEFDFALIVQETARKLNSEDRLCEVDSKGNRKFFKDNKLAKIIAAEIKLR